MSEETTVEATAEETLQTEYPQVDLAVLESTLEYIRPALQADGGDLVLLGVEGGTVNLQMVGACGGCPLSTMTLKAGIERILTERVPGVEEVNAF
jgi:Fe-S cluster biogenesis protein NfuA